MNDHQNKWKIVVNLEFTIDNLFLFWKLKYCNIIIHYCMMCLHSLCGIYAEIFLYLLLIFRNIVIFVLIIHRSLPMHIDERHFNKLLGFFRCLWLIAFLMGEGSNFDSRHISKLGNLILNFAVTFNILFYSSNDRYNNILIASKELIAK